MEDEKVIVYTLPTGKKKYIPESLTNKFEAQYPDATQAYQDETGIYDIAVKDRDDFLKNWHPNAALYDENAQQQPVQQQPIEPQQPIQQQEPVQAEPEVSKPDSINGHPIPSVHTPNIVARAEHKKMRENLPEDWEEQTQSFEADNANAVAKIDEALAGYYKEAAKPSIEKEKKMGGFLASIHSAGQAEAGGGIVVPQAQEIADNKEVKELQAARKLYDEAAQTRNAAVNDSGFGRGLANSFTVSNWDFGISDLMQNAALMAAAEKYEKHMKLTDSEQALLDAAAHKMASDMYYGDFLGRGYKAGLTTGESLPFMAEFMINPASGGAKEGANVLTRALGNTIRSKIGAKYGTKVAREIVKRPVLKKAIQATGRVAGDLEASALMAASTGAAGVMADTFDRMLGDVKFKETEDGIKFDGVEGGEETFWGAFAKAYGARTIENFSEMFGEYFSPIRSASAGAVKWINSKIGLEKVNKFIENIGTAEWMGAVKHFINKTHWNGLGGEFGEEIVGGIMNALTVGDQELNTGERGVFNRDNLIDTFLGVAAFGGFVSAVKTAGYRTPRQQNETSRRKLSEQAAPLFAEEGDWQQIQQQLDAADENQLKVICSTATEPGSAYTDDQKIAILRYAKLCEERIGMEKGRAKKEAESPEMAQLDAIYDAAVTTHDPEEKRAAKVEYDNALAACVDAGLTEDEIAELDKDPSAAGFISDDVNKMRVMDRYVKARAALTGINDSINADMESDIAAAHQDIDAKTAEDGNYYDITLKNGMRVGMKSGALAHAEDGSVDKANSSDKIYVTYPDGTVKVVAPKDVKSFTMAPAADLKAQAEQQIRQAYQQQLANDINTRSKQEVADSLTGEEEAFNVNGQTIMGTAVQVTQDGNVIIELSQPVTKADGTQQSVLNVPIAEFDKMRMGTVAPTPQVEEQPVEAAEKPAEQPEAAAQEETPAEAEVQPQPAQSPTETDFRGKPLPVRADGKVDQKALFENDPEAWAEWNNKRRADDGSDSRNYIKGEIKRKEKEIADLQKKYAGESDFDKRDELSDQIKAAQQRIASLQQASDKVEARARIREQRELEPQSLDELVAQYLAAYKGSLDKEDFMRETGYSDSDLSGFVGGFVKENPDAVGVSRLAEIIKESDDTGLTSTLSDMDIRDAILDVMHEVKTWGEVNNYVKNKRAAQKEEEDRQIREAVEAAKEAAEAEEAAQAEQPEAPAETAGVESQPVAEEVPQPAADTEETEAAETQEVAEQPAETAAQPAETAEEQPQEPDIFNQPQEETEEQPTEEQPQQEEPKAEEPQAPAQEEKQRPYAQVHKKVDKLSDALNTPIVVHDDITTVTDEQAKEAIAKGENVKGWKEDDGSVHIYAPNATSLRDVEQTIFHELVGHKGMEEMLGTAKYNELCDRVWQSMNLDQKTYWLGYVSHIQQRKHESEEAYLVRKARAAADEYIANIAENMTTEDFEKAPSVWKEIVEFFRKALGLESTDAEISELLRQSYRNLAQRKAESQQDFSEDAKKAIELGRTIDEKWREWLMNRDVENNYAERAALASQLCDLLRNLDDEELKRLLQETKGEMKRETQGELEFRDRQRRNTDVGRAIAGVQTLPAVKAKPLGKFDIFAYTVKDETRPAMGGVFHDGGFAVASDAGVLVADKESYEAKKEGKIVGKDGKAIDGQYPDWKSLFVGLSEEEAPMDIAGLRDFIASAQAAAEKRWQEDKAKGLKVGSKKDALNKSTVYVKVGDQSYRFPLGRLSRFVDYAAKVGATGFKTNGRGMIAVETENGKAVLMSMYADQMDGSVEDVSTRLNEDFGVYSYWPEGEQKQALEETKEEAPAETPAEEPAEEPEAEDEEQEEPVAEEIRKEDEATDEAKKNPQVSIASNQEKYEDFGEKIGMARKDVAASGFTRKTGEDSQPAWKKKYRTTNVRVLTDEEIAQRERFGYSSKNFEEDAEELGKGTDFGKPFIGYWEEEKKTYFGKRYVKHYITGQDRKPIIFTSQEQFEATVPVFEAKDQGYRVRKSGDKYKIMRPASNGKMVEYAEFDSEEEAVAYLTSPEGATSLLNRKRENYELPALGRLTRNGMTDYRGGRNVTPEDFSETFKFRGGEFGNWLNAEERQQFLNYAYDALMDLANILGIQPSALSLNGELSIAFGARGRQGAVAHYEPQRAVINLTKMKGAGSLAHEWAHALDNYFGLMDARKTRDREAGGEVNRQYLSEGPINYPHGVREEMRKAFSEVMEAITRKTVTRKIEEEASQKRVDEVRKTIDREIDVYKTRLQGGRTTYKYNRKTKKREEVKYKLTPEQIAEFEKLAKQLETDPTFEWKFDLMRAQGFRAHGEVATKLYDLVKDVMPDRRAENYGPLNDLFYYMARLRPQLERLERAKRGETETVTVDTKVKEDSLWFDRDRAGEYFSKDVEMFARAFEAYVNEKMEEQGQSSDYLVYEKGSIYEANWGHNPYPSGEELAAVSKAFDTLFDTVQERDENGRSVLFRKTKKNGKNQRNRVIFVKGAEGDVLKSAVNKKRGERFPVETVTTLDYFYIYENPHFEEDYAYSNGEIGVLLAIPIDGNEEKIKKISQIIKDGTYKDRASAFGDIMQSRRARGVGNRNNAPSSKERGRDAGLGRVDRSGESDGAGDTEQGGGDTQQPAGGIADDSDKPDGGGGGGTAFRKVTDTKKIEELENGEKEVGYRNVVMKADGMLGSPMADKLGRKGYKSVKTSPFAFGEWEESEENPDMATDEGKINLIKPEDLGSVGGVDYNPYIHIRPNMLNKQFTQAWKRPDLVYVETLYPTSELTSGHKAEKAALPVGRHEWNNGDLILSRWDKPTRVVPWEEVADEWVKEFKDSGVTFDIVPPGLLPILKERGVKILPPKVSAGKPAMDAYRDTRFRFIGEKGAARADAVSPLGKRMMQVEVPKEKSILDRFFKRKETRMIEKAVTRIDLLDVAKKMAAASKDATTIKRATGWEIGKDGKWRYEEPDIKLNEELVGKVMAMDASERKAAEYPISEVLAHDKEYENLIAEYPSILDITVSFYNDSWLDFFDSTRGYFNPSTRKMMLNPVGGDISEMASTLVHEVQHIIQDEEGFAPGGNTSIVDKYGDIPQLKEKENELRERADRILREDEEWNRLDKEYDRLYSEPSEEYRKYKEDFEKQSRDFKEAMQNYTKVQNEVFKWYNDELTKLYTDKSLLPFSEEFERRKKELIQERDRRLPKMPEVPKYESFNGPFKKYGYDDYSPVLKQRDARRDAMLSANDGGLADIKKEHDQIRRDLKSERYRLYKSIAGEVEARNVQSRMKMTDEERRASTAEDTEDIARAEQILLNDKKPAAETRFRVANENQEMFVSNAAKALDGIKQEKATPEQWLKMLEKNGGLKAGEDKWLGLSQWLKEKAKPVSFDDYFDKTKVEWKNVGSDIALEAWNKEYSKKGELHYSPYRNSISRYVIDRENGKIYRFSDHWGNVGGCVWTIDYENQFPEENRDKAQRYGRSNQSIGVADIKDFKRLPLTKQEIADFIAENKIQIEETKYVERAVNEERAEKMYPGFSSAFGIDSSFGDVNFYVKDEDAARSLYERVTEDRADDLTEGDLEEFAMKLAEDASRHAERTIQETRLNYTTGGLENKREIALTVPTIEPWNETDMIHFGDAGEGRAIAWIRFGDATILNTNRQLSMDDAHGLAKSMRDVLVQKAEAEDAIQRVSGRRLEDEKKRLEQADLWLETAKEEYGVKPKRVLFIDEIQSKRHQQAREKDKDGKEMGYATPLPAEEVKKREADYDAVAEEMGAKYGSGVMGQAEYWDEVTAEDKARIIDVRERYQEIEKAKRGVRPAPFEKNWHELAMKRMLRLAAEEGYDYVAWTKGDQQTVRYNLGGVLNSVERRESNNLGEKDFTLYLNNRGTQYIITDEEGNVIRTLVDDFRNKRLSDIVGKELAARMLAMKENEEIKGEGLRIGGEGMRGFYDEMLPRFMNKYGKQWGAKTEDMDFPLLEGGITAHAIPVTAEMKESVMKGQTMFRKAENDDQQVARAVASITGRSEEDVLDEIRQRREDDRNTKFRKVDEEYAKAVEQGDQKKVEELIREAAKIAMPNTKVVDKKGNPKIVYHGTSSEQMFHTFNDGDIYMVSKYYHAEQYTHKRGMISVSPAISGRVMPVFVNLENPLVMDANRRLWNNLLPPWPVYPATPVTTEDVARYAREHGYDGVIIKRVRDNMFNDDPTYADDIIAFDSSQIKSAGAEYESVKNWHFPWETYDNVKSEIGPTYDDEGNLIPLSERFDTSKSDIRFRKAPLPDDLKGRYEARLNDLANKVRESHQDSMLALKILQEEIVKATGRPLETFEDAYTAENQLSSKNSAEKEFYQRNFFEPMMKSVRDMMTATGISYEDAIKYAIAKHGLERNLVFHERDEQAKGEPVERRDYSGLTSLFKEEGEDEISLTEAEDRALAYVNEVENKAGAECATMWTKIKEATKKALLKSKESGILTRSEYESIRDMFNFYVPLRGFDEETAEQHYEYLDHKSSPYSPAMRSAKGRTSVADDPFATIGTMWESTVQQGNNNLVKQNFLHMVMNHPNDLVTIRPMWYTYDPAKDEWSQAAPKITDTMSAEEIQQEWEDFNERMEQMEQQGLASKKKPKKGMVNLPYRLLNKQDQEHMVVVKSGGREQVVIINGNPRAAQALNGLTNPDRQDFLEKMAQANRWMAANFTTRSPKFVVRNLIRDTLFSLFSIDIKEDKDYNHAFRGNVARNYGRIWKLMRRFQNGEFDDVDDADLTDTERLFKEFMMNGGETGYTQLKRVDEYKKMINRMVGDLSGEKLHGVKNAGRAIGDMVGFANRCVEDICRLSAYMTSRQMGRDIQTSVANAKEISVNFNKKGSGSGYGSSFARAAYLFYNAGVQGLQNFVNIRKNSKKHWSGLKKFDVRVAETVAMGAMIPFLNAVISAAVGGDDDEYADMPEWVRRNNLTIGGGGFYLTVPLPIELRALYGIGDIAYMTMAGRMKDRTPAQIGLEVMGQVADIMPLNPVEGVVANKGKNTFEGLILSVVPDVAAPVAQAVANVDFTGRPIYRKGTWNESDPAYTKAYAGTSKILVKSAEFLNRVTGGDEYKPGAVDVNPAIVEHLLEGYFGGMLTFLKENSKTVQMTWDDDMRQLRNVPIANILFQKNDERTASSYVNDMYYHYKEESAMTTKRANGYRKSGDMERAAKLAASDEYRRSQYFKAYEKQVDKLEKQLKEVSDKASETALRKQIAETKKQMVEQLTEMD